MFNYFNLYWDLSLSNVAEFVTIKARISEMQLSLCQILCKGTWESLFNWKQFLKVKLSIMTRLDLTAASWQMKNNHWMGNTVLPWLFRMSQKSNLITVLLYIISKKITTNAPEQSHLKWYCYWRSCIIARATYRFSYLLADNWLSWRLRWFQKLAVGS